MRRAAPPKTVLAISRLKGLSEVRAQRAEQALARQRKRVAELERAQRDATEELDATRNVKAGLRLSLSEPADVDVRETLEFRRRAADLAIVKATEDLARKERDLKAARAKEEVAKAAANQSRRAQEKFDLLDGDTRRAVHRERRARSQYAEF